MPQKLYRCIYCHSLFLNEQEAIKCEDKHLFEYRLKHGKDSFFIDWFIKVLKSRNEDPCSYCKNAYYVYGCEFDCEKKECCRRPFGPHEDYACFELKEF